MRMSVNSPKCGVRDITFKVVKRLPDDTYGSRHQRFLVVHNELEESVLISHNIDLAEPVPLMEGDLVRLSGRYEWNEKGGVIHWTHHDPRGNQRGGWIEHEGKRYE